MDPSEHMKWDNEDTPLIKTMKGATMGLAAGTIWGTVLATWYDVPRVERKVALPGLIRTLKMMGNCGVRFAAIGGIYIGVEQLLENYRVKKDMINGAVGGFVAGAVVHGSKARSITTGICAGASFAVVSAIIDLGGQKVFQDDGSRELYPYNTKKRSIADS
ncbi:outer envelope pore protein 16-3 chloroplastic/mitochondrial-like [Tripterygium wilfordii]|uniref:Outer envelope pore protein 16-3 chloroplastic/mitochondrial-like n=1 Tax=Tripterygium wilfordii TaxID=458696 RepID=A0A7J7DN11_TRIWF|nr:outer envelope pore protein 16-3, chloroplastic/mitochondrial [Tripterygium wilfordii]XP_038701466.1 outer envelope pore protein 16-3, chloroplastic/mitochondrial [Tripterygium wilfordii]KAF5747707.1 outer envelope pore protein 16-3 chloroplastic/mitochondrial-like [Tripterygium wilfordii]